MANSFRRLLIHHGGEDKQGSLIHSTGNTVAATSPCGSGQKAGVRLETELGYDRHVTTCSDHHLTVLSIRCHELCISYSVYNTLLHRTFLQKVQCTVLPTYFPCSLWCFPKLALPTWPCTVKAAPLNCEAASLFPLLLLPVK